jgi:hypothetical protein
MSTRRWLAIAGFSCALLGAWGAVAFLRESRGDERGERGASSTPTAAAAASVDPAAADRAGKDDGAREASSAQELTPTVVAVDPRLDWPDATTLRQITRRGRTLFGGVVYAPDGSPCPGATVTCNGDAIATSDDRGAWRADVGRSPYYDFDADVGFNHEGPSTYQLTAQKEGVGYAERGVDASSRRVDLHLERGFALRGTVVDNDDLHPVGGAELEAHVRALVERVHADERGAFAFENLPSGGLDLSGRAPGYDSNGTFPYNFERGRDVTITFRLTKAYRLRGKFAPWPPPDVAAATAAVVVKPKSPHGGPSAPRLEGKVGDDGAFDVTLPVCPECHVELACEGGTVWQTDVDVNEEKHDVDLGRIELAGAAAVTGRVEVRDEWLRSAVQVTATVTVEGGRPAIACRNVAADGSFRIAPLPAGWCAISFAMAWLDFFRTREAVYLHLTSDLSSSESGEACVQLSPGETRDVGVFTSADAILFGTVRDARGEPIALAQVREYFDARGLSFRERGFRMLSSDEEGRYRGSLGPCDGVPFPLELMARARGFTPIRVEIERPADGSWIRRDFVLEDGVVLRGTLQDESGTPLSDWVVRATPAGVPDDRADDVTGFDVTQADGSFEIHGLAAGEWTIRSRPKGGTMLEFTKIHPENGAITLRTTDGVAVSKPRPR